MQKFYTFTGHCLTPEDIRVILTKSALVIPSPNYSHAAELLRTCYYRTPEPKPVPWIKRATYQLLGRQPRFDPSKKIPLEAVRRMLILRYDGLGDYLITTPLLQWLRSSIPKVEIDVLTSQRNDILAAQDPSVHIHVPIQDRPQFHLSVLNAVKLLQNRHYNLVIALVFTNMTRQTVLARLLAPAADYVTVLNNRIPWLYGKFFHRQVPHAPWQRHWLETFFSIGPTIFDVTNADEPMPDIWLPRLPSAEENVFQFLTTHGLGSSSTGHCNGSDCLSGMPFIIVNISASDDERSLGYEQACTLCGTLRARYPHYAIVLVSSPHHRQRGERIAEVLGPPVYFYHRRFFEMVPLIERCIWLITPDTVLIHIAAALKKPIIGLYHRPITVCEWYPYGTSFTLVLSMNGEGIAALSVDAIVYAAELLDGTLVNATM